MKIEDEVYGDIKQWNQLLQKQHRKQASLQMKYFRFFRMPDTWGLYGGLDVDDVHKKKGLD